MEKEEKTINEKIEILRTDFLKTYKKEKITSLIILVAFIILMLVSLLLLKTMPDKIHYVFIAIFVVFLGTYVITKKIKKSRENNVKTYVENYRLLVNEEVYSQIGLEDYQAEPFEKIEMSEMEKINILEDLSILESNDLVKGKFNGNSFFSSNVASYNSKNAIIFYGKLLAQDFKIDINGKIVICLKTNEGNGPKVEGLIKQKSFIDERFETFTSLTDDNFNKVMTQNIQESIKKLEINEKVKDITLVIIDNKFYTLLSTRNDLIDVPLKEPLQEDIVEEIKKNISLFFEISKGLNNNE